MKIALVANTSWYIYNSKMGLTKKLIQQGHEVHIISPKDHYVPLIIKAGCTYHDIHICSQSSNPFKDFILCIRLWIIYKRVNPDIIMHHTIKPNIYGALVARTLNIPTINNVCGLGTVFLTKGITSAIALMLYRFSFRFPKKVFFENSIDMNLFIRKQLVSAQITDLIPGVGVNLKKYYPLQFNRNKSFTFLLIARLILDKGILEYVEAARQLKQSNHRVRFQLIGEKVVHHKRGIQSHIIDQWNQEKVIDYLGTTDDIRACIEKADCVVLPSYREGTPRALLEACSSARPVIATNVPGCTNVVDHDVNGLICRKKDSKDLAEKMDCMANFNDTRLKKMGENGREKMVKEFDENIVINKYLHTFVHLSDLIHAK